MDSLKWNDDFNEWFNMPSVQSVYKSMSDWSDADSMKDAAKLAWYASYHRYTVVES